MKIADVKLSNGKTLREIQKECGNTKCTECEYRDNFYCPRFWFKGMWLETTDVMLPYEIRDVTKSNLKKVYICSPYKGNIEENVSAAQRFCEWTIMIKKVLPIAPHLYFTQFLNDNNAQKRRLGMNMGLTLMQECCEIWVLGDIISSGMKKEIIESSRLNIPIRFFTENGKSFSETESAVIL